MANECGKITAGLVADICGKAPVSGTASNVVLINYADIDKTKSVVTGNVASSIVLKTGKKGYHYISKEKATSGSSALASGTYLKLFTHTVTLRIFLKNQESKDFINSLKDARLVVIIENREEGKDGDVKYEVYGWDSGLICTELPAATELSDGVVYAATLSSEDASQEGQIPLSYFSTDLEATETALKSLYE